MGKIVVDDGHRDEISPRAFLERILEERDRQYDWRYQAQKEALALVVGELSRRLDAVNHAHEQSLQDRADFVRSDTHRTFVERIEELQELTTARIHALELRTANAVTAQQMDDALKPLNDLRSKAVIGAGAVALFSATVGAIIAALMIRLIG